MDPREARPTRAATCLCRAGRPRAFRCGGAEARPLRARPRPRPVASGSTGRILDPSLEGQDLLQILDWAEENLEWLAYDPNGADTGLGKGNPIVGAIGSSYGGGFQHLVHAIDTKHRLDAIAPDITWHDLRNSLNPGDAAKTMWSLALVGIGESSGNASLDLALVALGTTQDPFNGPLLGDGQDPFVKETLARAVATNEFPRQALDWFRYHSLGNWCAASGLPAMPYLAYGDDITPMLLADEADTLFQLNEVCSVQDPSWHTFFVEAVTDLR